MRIASAVVLLALVSATTGCGNGSASRSERLDGQTIMPTRGRLPTEPYSPVDQPGQLPYDDARALRDRELANPRPAPGPSTAANRALDSAVAPLAEPFDQSGPPSTRPATTASPGGYTTIGGVVAEVNGVPIYAHKVISDIEPLLSAQARKLGEAQFKELAEQELNKQVRDNINGELLFAAANRLLDQQDKEQGRYIAEQWRQQQITKAGGSIEMARRREATRGRDLEELVRQEYRLALSRLLLRKRVIPKIQVTANEMREYYDRNVEKEYTIRDAVQFEMIQVDPAKVGGRDLAKQKIEEYRARAEDGGDFTALTEYSNGPRLRNSAGELSWIERNAFMLGSVEAAVWKLQPGETTPVIEEGGKFYIAKLVQKRPGRVVPFEDETTQEQIKDRLWQGKFRPEYDKMIEGLKGESIVRTDPAMMQSALEIAMQRYPLWAGK